MKLLISGSSSGIGRAIAEKMLAEEHCVIGLARNHVKFNPSNNNYLTYAIDFAKIEILEKELQVIQKQHATVDTLIICTGYGEFAELEQFSVAKMQNMLNVNFLSQVILIKTFLPALKKKKAGKIIILGSECALEGQKKGTLYCATKFALRGFAQSLRKECAAANISVTLINPGFVRTPFFDNLAFQPSPETEHAIQPEQIAHIVSTLINQEPNCVYEEINLQPLKKVIVKNGVI